MTIQSASVAATGAAAPHCGVKGTIAPADMFELWLPTQSWTQRCLQVGCGGLCGMISVSPPMASTSQLVAGGTIAMAATDMGHQSQSLGDASWSANNPQAQIDFA